MKYILCILLTVSLNLSCAQTTVSAGNVSGTWTKAGSPYRVNGNIVIPNGQTLTIEPGVRIEFAHLKYLDVQGRIVAVGGNKSTDSIWFSKQQTHDTGNWKGIRLINTPNTNDTSVFKYCVLRNCKSLYDTSWNNYSGGLRIRGYGKVKIQNSTFYLNEANLGSSIFLSYGASVSIISCTFKRNKVSQFTYTSSSGNQGAKVPKGSCIFLSYASTALVDSCIFKDNINGKDYSTGKKLLFDGSVVEAVGADIYDGGTLVLRNSVFDNNEGNNLVAHYRAKVTVNNCQFINAPYSPYNNIIRAYYQSRLTTENCIMKNNQCGILFWVEGSKYTSISDVISNNSNYLGLSMSRETSSGIQPYASFINSRIYNNSYDITNIELAGVLMFENMSGCLVANNKAKRLLNGGKISNSTIVNNYGTETVLGFVSDAAIKNNIIWGNKSDSAQGRQIRIFSGYKPEFSNNIIEKDTANFWLKSAAKYSEGYPKTYQNNLSVDPLFVSPTAGYGTGYNAATADFSFKNSCMLSSPALNAGSADTSGMMLPKTDIRGNKRFYENRLDIGAYEDNLGSRDITISRVLSSDSFCEQSRQARLHLSAYGQGLVYQWQKSSNSGGSWINISGAPDDDTVTLASTPAGNNDLYRVILKGTCDTDTSTTGRITVFALPEVRLGNDTAVCRGQQVSRTATGTGSYLWHNGSTNASMNQAILKDTAWWVQLTDQHGCIGRDTVLLTAKALPVIDLGPDQSIHQLRSMKLDAGAGHAKYLWNDGSQAQTKTFFGQDLGPAGTYMFWTEVESANGCRSRDSVNITVVYNLNTQIPQHGGLRIYPQPFCDKLIIEGEGLESVGVYTSTGQLIGKQTGKDMIEFGLGDQPPGIYILQLSTSEGQVIRLTCHKL